MMVADDPGRALARVTLVRKLSTTGLPAVLTSPRFWRNKGQARSWGAAPPAAWSRFLPGTPTPPCCIEARRNRKIWRTARSRSFSFRAPAAQAVVRSPPPGRSSTRGGWAWTGSATLATAGDAPPFPGRERRGEREGTGGLQKFSLWLGSRAAARLGAGGGFSVRRA